VPDFLPFPGSRYRHAPDSSSVVAPPYDVIDEEERAQLETADPHNAVRLILPRAAPPADPYQHAASTLDDWYAEGVLEPDPAPAFYGYRMRFTDEEGTPRHTLGVIGALSLPTDDREDVFPHEQTLPKARRDRLELLRATRTNLDPIWCLSLAEGLSDLLEPHAAPVTTAIDEHGTTHDLVPLVERSRLDSVRACVAGAPLVLADGHHRFETACTYRGEHPDDRAASSIMTFVVPLDETMLDVRAIHRLLHHAPTDLRGRLAARFEIEPVGGNTEAGVDRLLAAMRDQEALGLVDGEGLALLRPDAAALDAVRDEQPPELYGVDAARFETAIRPALADAELSYRDDGRSVAGIVAKGGADAAVLLRPVTVDQIRAAAFARVRMPAKTTFFWPKPRTGMVLRRFADETEPSS
jgi:uncharacterized protein (DUF1015 family)